MNTTQQHLPLEQVSEDKDIQVIFNLPDGEIGYGLVSLSEDEETPYRVSQYQGRFNPEDFEKFEALDSALSKSELYTQDVKTRLDAINHTLDFWLVDAVKEVQVLQVNSDKEAIEQMLASKADYLFYTLS